RGVLTMPRPRRRARVRRPDLLTLTKCQRWHLELGTCFFGDCGLDEDEEAFAESWDIHRETIMAECIAGDPRRRPYAWWLLDHDQERPTREREEVYLERLGLLSQAELEALQARDQAERRG